MEKDIQVVVNGESHIFTSIQALGFEVFCEASKHGKISVEMEKVPFPEAEAIV